MLPVAVTCFGPSPCPNGRFRSSWTEPTKAMKPGSWPSNSASLRWFRRIRTESVPGATIGFYTERLFRRLKGFRRIFSRFEKLDVMFTAFIHFALIVEALRPDLVNVV